MGECNTILSAYTLCALRIVLHLRIEIQPRDLIAGSPALCQVYDCNTTALTITITAAPFMPVRSSSSVRDEYLLIFVGINKNF